MSKRPFTIQYASDIHLEFQDLNDTGIVSYETFIRPVADYLALCGDIGYPEKPALLTFLSWCSRNFKEVYWVPGNHEFYTAGLEKKATYDEKLDICEKICCGFKNVHFMHRKVRQVPGWNLRIAGCTMWTDLESEDQMTVIESMNDIRQIYTTGGKTATLQDFYRWHQEDKNWLKGEISCAATAQEDIIVLTHHLPSFKLIHSKYNGHPLNICFASDLEHMMKAPVRGWLCGHSHTAGQIEIAGVQCGLNPFGYPEEDDSGYSREKILEIICDSDVLPSYEYCDGDCDCDEYFDFDDTS